MRILLSFLLFFSHAAYAADVELLHVSYDPTRELFDEVNPLFIEDWKELTGDTVKIYQSHGGSGKQTRSIIDGLQADVVTLALAADIDVLVNRRNLIDKNWREQLPHDSTPYLSTVVFMVRKDNPKKITDWGDLVRSDVKVITPNPKTSGGARWNYLAAWAYATNRYGDSEKAKTYMRNLFKNVPVLDSAARGSTISFVQRELGDVLISWENEAYLAQNEFGKDAFEIVYPSISILAEPPAALVRRNAERKGVVNVAQAYLQFMFTPKVQELIAKHHFRPVIKEVVDRHRDQYPKIKMKTIADLGGWAKVQDQHFTDGGIFDEIYGE